MIDKGRKTRHKLVIKQRKYGFRVQLGNKWAVFTEESAMYHAAEFIMTGNCSGLEEKEQHIERRKIYRKILGK